MFTRSWLTFVMASALMGCHPQAAVTVMPGVPRPLDQETVEVAVRARVGDLSPCLLDAEVVPGQASQRANLQLSINESGRTERVTVQNVEDSDMIECLTHKVSEWTFPPGGVTATRIELRLQDKSAELANLRILPLTRTADR